MNQNIKKLYDELINPKNALSEKEFLEKLIKFEDYTKINIYRTLLTKNDKEIVRKSKEYRAIKSLNSYSIEQVKKDNMIRNELEKNAINNLVGEKVSIKDIINIYSKNINNILKQNIDIKEKLNELNIVYDEVEGVILPPEGEARIITGSGKGVEKKEGFDRFSLLLERVLNADNGFYTGDYRIIIGKNRKNMMRETSYIVIEIPKINKTIFVNNEYGEATFIYDGIPFDSEIQEKGKLSYKSEFNKIKFIDPDQWIEQVKQGLSNSKEGEENRFKNIEAKNLKESLNREEFIKGTREYLENNIDEKNTWLSAGSLDKRSKLKITINGKTYKGGSIVSHIFNEIPSDKAKNYFRSPKGYIEVLKSIFGEDNDEVNTLIKKIEGDIKENLSREEFIKGTREYLESNLDEKSAWLSADSGEKRRKLKIKINGKTYKGATIISHLFNEIPSKDAFGFFTSPKGYIEVLKSIFGEDNDEVNILIKRMEGNTREEFIEKAREFLENNLDEKNVWLSADSNRKRHELKIIINGIPYKGCSIVSHIFSETSPDKAEGYFISPKGYIEVLKTIFGENNDEVNTLIKKIEGNIKENFSKEEFIAGAKEYLENNLDERNARLSADSRGKRNELKIIINGRIYKGAAIVSYISNEIGKNRRKDYFKSPKGYIEILKIIFGENNPDVIKLMHKIIKK